MDVITMDDVNNILHNPSADRFKQIYRLYYDIKNPHHTSTYLIGIFNIRDKLNLLMSTDASGSTLSD